MKTEPILLKIESLKTRIETKEGLLRAVDGLSLNINHHETLVLLGESGCGKSLTALSILNLLPNNGYIAEGAIQFDGVDLRSLNEKDMCAIRGKRIGMIFQEPNLSLDPLMPVGKQIEEVLLHHTELRGKSAHARVLELLNAVGIPDPGRRQFEYPHQLSGGIRQRIVIAAAIAGNPELLIADEPTTALDVTIQAQVLDLLRDIQKRTHMSMLLITHDLGIASGMADRIAVMYAGEIVEVAPRDRFFSYPSHPYSKKLFAALPNIDKRKTSLTVISGNVPSLTKQFRGCRFAERCDAAWDLCHSNSPEWTKIHTDHSVRCHLWSSNSEEARINSRISVTAAKDASQATIAETDTPTLLDVNNLRVYFPIREGLFRRVAGKVKAVDDLSLRISPGKTLALVGESGCGKTTAAKAILRLIPATSGQIWFDGDDILNLEPAKMRAKRSDLQIIFQDPYSSLNPDRRVAKILSDGMRVFGIGENSDDRSENITTLLESVGLDPLTAERYPSEFSGGQRQRIAIARALSVHPKLIICDEPTSALDVSVQAQILNLLKQLQNAKGLAYLFITHNISVVEFMADELAVMYLGRIVERGSTEEVLANPQHPYTKALLSAVPVMDKASHREVIKLDGDLPSPANPPSGCHFHQRCPEAMPQCSEKYPKSTTISDTHSICCHLHQKN